MGNCTPHVSLSASFFLLFVYAVCLSMNMHQSDNVRLLETLLDKQEERDAKATFTPTLSLFFIPPVSFSSKVCFLQVLMDLKEKINKPQASVFSVSHPDD